MMSLLEYAEDIKRSVEEIAKKCEQLDITVKNNDQILTEEQIIDLDNAFANEEEEEELENIDTTIEDTVVKIGPKPKPVIPAKKVSKKPKKDLVKKNNISVERKEMYKNREKLVSNVSDADDLVALYNENMTIKDLSEALCISTIDVIKKFMSLGVITNINTVVSFEDAEVIALEYNKKLKMADTQDHTNFEKFEISDDACDLVERPAVITIMGHVDHGKTSLLDAIRESSVTKKEHGGITQHIGAYQIMHENKKMTFIDTPGHAAFTEMRARGAGITDIVVIVVAADDGVMPQTKEAIDHAKAAKVPIIVAVNKIDKEGIDTERILREMADYGVSPDIWGGDTMFINVSAITKEGIDKLLESILLVAEMAELKGNPKRYATGTVIESKLDKNVGSIVTLLIQNGTLRLGDPIVVGQFCGKVRTLKNDLGEQIVEADLSLPVEITGISGVPTAGDKFMAFETEREAHSTAQQRKVSIKEKQILSNNCLTLDDFLGKTDEDIKEINIVLKADVKGSEEAVKNTLLNIEVEGANLNIIRSGVGAITENDITLADASNAMIIGFNIRVNAKIMDTAKKYCINIRMHNIIYKLVEEIEAAMKGMLDPIYKENPLGKAEVRRLFKFSKTGTIAGSYVLEGTIKRNCKARVLRGDEIVFDGVIASLQREKDQVKEVKNGLECGITIEDYQDLQENDIIDAYEMKEVKR